MSIPSEFMCPISMDLMTDPVVGSDGHTYERSAITEWLSTRLVSPLTRRQMFLTDLQPNYALRTAIERWRLANEPTPEPSTIPQPVEQKPFTVKAKTTSTEMVLEINTTHSRPLESVLIAVIDVSGSMSSSASNKPQTEAVNFSRLDLVKHSMKTLANLFAAEYPNIPSSLSIISFSNSASTLMPVTKMDEQGLIAATAAINRLAAEGGTNIWDGLRLALTQAATVLERNTAANIQILLLTDGEPSPGLLPPLGIKDTLKRKMATLRSPVTISTFGFGYNLDCELLESICELGAGSYCFIPDCSMVGTVFINWATKALLTLAHHVSLKLVDGSIVHVGDIIIGKPQTLLLPTQPISSVDIVYDNKQEATVQVEHINGPIQNEHYLDKLKNAVRQLKNTRDYHQITTGQLRELKAAVLGDSAPTELLQDIVRDIESTDDNEGQLMKSCSREDWWGQWGRNHCISYYRALTLQQCVNFKDKVLQHFAPYEFKNLQDKGIDIFSSIPAPTPTGFSSQQFNSFAPNPTVPISSFTVDMSNFINNIGGCFAGHCKVLMEDSRLKLVEHLRKGDRVWGGHTVEAVLYTPVNREIDMIMFHTGLQITPWHPMKLSDDKEWVFPNDVGVKRKTYVEAFYNLVLSSGHIVEINTYPVVTLGHGFRDNDVIAHPYFGTHAVIDDLKKHSGWNSGFLVMDGNHTVRSHETGMIQKIY
jgi:uncharacterized protein YegL